MNIKAMLSASCLTIGLVTSGFSQERARGDIFVSSSAAPGYSIGVEVSRDSSSGKSSLIVCCNVNGAKLGSLHFPDSNYPSSLSAGSLLSKSEQDIVIGFSEQGIVRIYADSDYAHSRPIPV